MKRIAIAAIVLVALSGCNRPATRFVEDDVLARQIFIECLATARVAQAESKYPGEVVSECSDAAWRLSSHGEVLNEATGKWEPNYK